MLVALDNNTRGGAGRAIRTAANEARSAAKDRFRTFRNKDIVQELTSFKKGSNTDIIDPSVVLEKILGPGNRLENIRRIKNALTTGKGPNKGAAMNAWNEIKSQALDDMFEGVIKEGKNGEFGDPG